MSTDDTLGDRMKRYEDDRRAMPFLPLMIRLDGRSFSTFTRGLARPYDARFSRLMVDVTRACVEETGARLGYTQSDEITLVLLQDDLKSQMYFDGRIQKIVSGIAAFASVEFNRALPASLPEKSDRHPAFDARVWNVPNEFEAANAVLWRELDATKNSVSMAASAYYSHRELLGKDRAAKHEMLYAKGVNWNDYPDFFKRGTYVRRETVCRKFSTEELDRLPPKHAARANPNLEIARTTLCTWHPPPLLRVANRVDLLFREADPILVASDP